MIWNAVQKQARAQGRLVFAMDQAQTPLAKHYGTRKHFAGGYCLGISAAWIRCQYNGENFATTSGVCMIPPVTAGPAQLLAKLGDHVTQWQQYWSRAVSMHLMSTWPAICKFRPMCVTPEYLSVVALARCCYGVTIAGAIGAHAVAFHHADDGKMHFFDPNFGHFVLPHASELENFLIWFLVESGYLGAFNDFCGVVGVHRHFDLSDAYKDW